MWSERRHRAGELPHSIKHRRRGNQVASDTEEAAAQAFLFEPAQAADDVERAETLPPEARLLRAHFVNKCTKNHRSGSERMRGTTAETL